MEADFLEWLRQRLPAHHPNLLLGPGDDAALLSLGQRAECLVTVDLLTDGVDFQLREVDPRRIGRKSLAVNLSDIAAMAARPLAAVVALALPRHGAMALAQSLYEGILPIGEEFGLSIAGGDTNCWDGPLAIAITLVGQATERGPLCRSGARPGDKIVVTGSFGGSILGRHFDFVPRVREALQLHQHYAIHAGMDVSDGLSLDLSRLCAASGCGAALRLDALPIAEAAHTLSAQSGDATALDHALSDGEDFELLLAIPADEASRLLRDQPLEVRLTEIGDFVPEHGLWQFTDQGRIPLAPRGWQH